MVDDIGVDAVKAGMLGNEETVACVAGLVADLDPSVPLVVDPVCVSKHGDRLIDQAALEALRTLLFPYATMITPNLDEAAALTERSPETPAPVLADLLLGCGPKWVLIKGGHGDGDAIDYLKIVPSHLAALQTGGDPRRGMPRRGLVLGGELGQVAIARGDARAARAAQPLVARDTVARIEALAVRADRATRFRGYLATVAATDFTRPIDVLENGTNPVQECIYTVFEEEFWHNRYAQRDLAQLEAAT